MKLNRTRRNLFVLLVVFVVLIASFVVLRCKCPASGIGTSKERRAFHRLKNRSALPQPADFDPNVSAATLLLVGEDSTRWSDRKAARVEAYVVSVANARPELANCLVDRDIHIHVALRTNAPPNEHLVVEVTPRMRTWAAGRNLDWSERTLKQSLVGRWVAFEGWLLFDAEHAGESENIVPGRSGNWRRTAWEIHPVTNIKVLPKV